MNLRRYNRILAQTSPSIIRSGSEDIRDKAWSCKAGFQRNLAMPNTSYIKIEDPRSQCKSSDHYKFVRSCSIQLFDIFNYKDTEQNCIISEYGSSKCMTGKKSFNTYVWSPIRNQEEPISWYLFLQLNIMTQYM